jgi:chitin disaccharide deacetylase
VDIIFHADDYGICLEQSRRILQTSNLSGGFGALNSLSILANSPNFSLCADELERCLTSSAPNSEKREGGLSDSGSATCASTRGDGEGDEVLQSWPLRLGVHLNVVEGRPCADVADIPLLVNEKGYFHLGFAHLLFMSLGPKRRALQEQLCIEIEAQLEKVTRRFPLLRDRLRVDSHQHFHLIPVVFDALFQAVEGGGYTLEYLRIPVEPTMPFLSYPRLYLTYRPVNWIKHCLLNFLWHLDRKQFPEYGVSSALFCGILLSGKMDEDRVKTIYPKFLEYARKRSMNVEFLFHPGAVTDAQECLDPKLTGFADFYLSEGRGLEAQALAGLVDWDTPKSC